MKKKISVLSASILFASTSNAAITSGSLYTEDSSAIAVLVGTNGSYVFDLGVSSRYFLDGGGGYIDVSAGFAPVGTLQGYAVFGSLACDSNCIGGIGYVDPGFGYLSLSSSPNPLAQADGFSVVVAINTYIDTVSSGGFFGIGTLAHLGNVALLASLADLIQAPASATSVYRVAEGLAPANDDPTFYPEQITMGQLNGLDGGTLFVNCSGLIGGSNCTELGTVVPIPATAWLFGSALLGLGAFRRHI